MVHERAAKPQPHRRPRGNARLLTLTALLIVIVGGETSLGAGTDAATLSSRSTATLPYDHGRPGHGGIGNGWHNKNDVTINSPSLQRGIQNISNGNVGGIHNIQSSFCKRRFRFCHIHQRMKVFDP